MAEEFSEEQVLGKAYDARLMRRLLTYLKPYRRSAVLAIACLIAGSAISIVQPYLTKVAIDQHIRNGDFNGLSQIAALYILTLLCVFALSFAQSFPVGNTPITKILDSSFYSLILNHHSSQRPARRKM